MASLSIAAPSVLRIQIEDFSPYYFPKSVEIRTGTPIFWNNPTATHHTITHDGCQTGEGLRV
jgi:hypothetical protein